MLLFGKRISQEVCLTLVTFFDCIIGLVKGLLF